MRKITVVLTLNQVINIPINSIALINPSVLGTTSVEIRLGNSQIFKNEGDIRKHETWERTRCRQAAEIVKRLEMQRVGRLRCHGCGTECLRTYGVEVIEAHHRVPLSELKESRIPNPNDFDLLCPSCHRAIHRLVPPDLTTLRTVLKRQRR